MNQVTNEIKYPIRPIWLLKIPLMTTVLFSLYFGFRYSYLIFILFLMYTFLFKKNFHFSIEDRFLHINEGVLSKSEKHMPYEAIQNIVIKQDIYDKIFGLGYLLIYNATSEIATGNRRKYDRPAATIKGLKIKDAEALREDILKKIKDNPAEIAYSGL